MLNKIYQICDFKASEICFSDLEYIVSELSMGKMWTKNKSVKYL